MESSKMILFSTVFITVETVTKEDNHPSAATTNHSMRPFSYSHLNSLVSFVQKKRKEEGGVREEGGRKEGGGGEAGAERGAEESIKEGWMLGVNIMTSATK